MTAGKIADVFEHAWPTTTRHIRMLESAGLFCHDQKGRNRASHINRRRVELLRYWLTWFSKRVKCLRRSCGFKEMPDQNIYKQSA